MFPVGYELGFYIPVDDILHSHRHENVKSLEVIIHDVFYHPARYSPGTGARKEVNH
jgi:hypothetical protein